jgi:hypothetical protein
LNAELPVVENVSDTLFRGLLLGIHQPDSEIEFIESMAMLDEIMQASISTAPGNGGPRTPPVLPAPRLIKTASHAEAYAAEFMRALGFADASVTPPGPDGGVDVRATGAIGQVKMEGVATGRPVVQALYGIASIEHAQGLIFSLAGYTREALQWAELASVACFEFGFDGSIEARSRAAEVLLAGGGSALS